MSYSLPSLEQLLKHAQERHRAELPGTDAFLWPNTEYILLKTVAGMVHMNFRYLEWIKRQRFATEADGDMLDGHGRPWGLARNPATYAHGNVIVTGTVGHTIAANTVFARSDGVQLRTTAEHVIGETGVITIAVEAVETGIAGNTAINTPLDLLVPDTDIESVAVDTIGIGGGTDIEDDESYRARILFRMRNPPRGGAAHDYVAWASSISGVTRVWVEDLAYGPGTVAVWFMTDGMTENGIPSEVSVGDVETYLLSVRPETARLFVKAPTPAALDVRIVGIRPNEAQQELIEAEIRDLFRRRVAVSMTRTPFVFRSSLVWQAVARITGDVSHTIVLPQDTTFPPDHIPVMGSICYV